MTHIRHDIFHRKLTEAILDVDQALYDLSGVVLAHEQWARDALSDPLDLARAVERLHLVAARADDLLSRVQNFAGRPPRRKRSPRRR